ncbi:hypothetical protein H9L39_11681 [Fusarium oxysporum f. sp. albedinis]|nr:hypothetical protein H9L39_11681 [Fusarium oxysporum f. sp. albedinis]
MHPRLAAQRTTTQQKQGTDELPIIEMSEGFRLRPSVAATGTKVYLSGAAPWPLDTRQASLVARNGLPFDIGQCIRLFSHLGARVSLFLSLLVTKNPCLSCIRLVLVIWTLLRPYSCTRHAVNGYAKKTAILVFITKPSKHDDIADHTTVKRLAPY